MLPCPNNTNGILLPQLSQPPPPVFSLGNDETLLHYDPHDLLSQYCLMQESYIIDHDNNKDHTAAGRTTTTSYVMDKNDGRHSKIFTANGPRDRRVRLSKDIARKFFDLQDLLGFDRASKTLDWLLTKSKPAIKELIKPIISSHLYSSTLCCSSSASECENMEESDKMNHNNKKKKRKRRINTSSGKKRKAVDDGIIMMAKEKRAKARERARERTKEKLFLKEVMNSGYSFGSLILSRESSSNFSHWSPNTSIRHENWDISGAMTSSSSSCFQPLNTMISTSSSSPGNLVN